MGNAQTNVHIIRSQQSMGQKKKKKRINYLPNNKSSARKITNTASRMTCGNLFTARCNIGIALGYIYAHMHKKILQQAHWILQTAYLPYLSNMKSVSLTLVKYAF